MRSLILLEMNFNVPTLTGKTQSKIWKKRIFVKFTIHSMTKTIYKQLKKLTRKKQDKTNHIKIRVSITRQRQKLLRYATKLKRVTVSFILTI